VDARGRALALVLATATSLGCTATRISEQRWLRARSAHFELLSSASEESTREIALALEQFRASLLYLLNRSELTPSRPTRIYVFGDEGTFARYRPRRSVAGFMLPRPWANYLAIDAEAPEEGLAIARHEYVHLVLHDISDIDYPHWYDEGLSEMLSTLHEAGERIVVGAVPQQRARGLSLGSPMSMRRMLSARQILRWPDHQLGRFYAQAWAMTHFFHSGHLVGFPERRDALVRFLGESGRGVELEVAFANAFGADIREVEADYLHFLGNNRIPTASFPSARIQYSGVSGIAPLTPSEQSAMLGELALACDDTALALELLGRAHQDDPGDASIAAMLAFAGARAGRPETQRLMLEAANAEPADTWASVWLANAWMLGGSALEGDEQRMLLERVEQGLKTLLGNDPQNLAALTALGLIRAQDDRGADEDDAIGALELAHRRLPGYEPVLTALAELYLRRGDPEKARQLLETAPHASHAADVDLSRIQDLMLRSGLSTAPADRSFLLEPQLEIDAPGDRQAITGIIPLLEVEGQAGLGELLGHDVVIALDESNSTLAGSGTDLDGNGYAQGSRRRTGNPDSILRAELLAARALVEQLDPETTRVALITFTSRGRVRAPLGSPQDVLAQLDRYEEFFDPTGTSLAVALYSAISAFSEAPAIGEVRHRSVILLSDGQATVPSTNVGERQALEAAELLGEHGIRIFAFGLGKNALKATRTYAGMAEQSGGRFIPLEEPGDIVDHIARVRLSGLEDVAIRNATTNQLARAVRIFPDGSFDAFLDLHPGENRVEVVVQLEGGDELREERTVVFGRPERVTPEVEQNAAAIRERLRVRSLEIELGERARSGRLEPRAGELEIEAEPDAARPREEE
jgi:thioredoxin-like negative regulator of GroEL